MICMLRGNIHRGQIKMVYYPAFHISKIDQNFEAKDLDQVNSMYLELQHVGWNLGKLEFTESIYCVIVLCVCVLVFILFSLLFL